jgi:hypothetical protein
MGDNVYRRRAVRVLLGAGLGALTFAGGGCGGDDSEPEGRTSSGEADESGATVPSASGETLAAAALEAFLEALVEGDAEAACDLLSERGVSYVEEGALTLSPQGGGRCARIIVASYGTPTEELLDGFEVVSAMRSTDGSIRLQFVNADTPVSRATAAVVRNEDGQWRVDSAGLPGQ